MFRPDITVMADWVLKINYLSIWFCSQRFYSFNRGTRISCSWGGVGRCVHMMRYGACYCDCMNVFMVLHVCGCVLGVQLGYRSYIENVIQRRTLGLPFWLSEGIKHLCQIVILLVHF